MSKILIALTVLLLWSVRARADLIAEYLFEGSPLDTSGYGREAVVHGATLTVDRFGRPDAAYAFDGNDYLQTPLNSNFTPLSFSVWFKADVVTGERSIVDSDVSGHWGHSLIIGYWNGDGTLDVQYHNSHVESGFSVFPNRWYHAVVTYSDTIGLWVDGLLIASQSYPANPFDGTDFRLGRHNEADPQWFQGSIDDVRFYDHVLASEEIQALAAEGVPEPASLVLLVLGAATTLGPRRKAT